MSSFSYSMQKGNEYAGKFPARHTRERTRLRTRRSTGTCGGPLPASARRKTAAHLVRRRNLSSLPVFFASFLFLSLCFFPGEDAWGAVFLAFFPSAGEKRLFRRKAGTAFRGGLIPERAFPATGFPSFRSNSHSGSAKRRKKRGKAATGATSSPGTFRRPGKKDGQKERQPKTTKAGEIVKKGQKGRKTADRSIQDDKSR